jgi:biopolymer transport protein ExbD
MKIETPLSDLAFQFLIIFVVTGSLISIYASQAVDQEVTLPPITLATASGKGNLDGTTDRRVATISISERQGAIVTYLNDNIVNPAQLSEFLSLATPSAARLRVGKDVGFKEVAALLDLLNAKGVSDISFIVEKGGEGDQHDRR